MFEVIETTVISLKISVTLELIITMWPRATLSIAAGSSRSDLHNTANRDFGRLASNKAHDPPNLDGLPHLFARSFPPTESVCCLGALESKLRAGNENSIARQNAGKTWKENAGATPALNANISRDRRSCLHPS